MAVLTDSQVNRVWQRMLEAEIRSLYFGELAARFAARKQIITAVSFFLASGAAASVIAKLPALIPSLLALLVAAGMAYSIAFNLDNCIRTMTKLHCEWNRLSSEYDRLWNHWQDDDAEQVLRHLLDRAAEVSEAAMGMPYSETAINRWTEIVYARFQQPLTA